MAGAPAGSVLPCVRPSSALRYGRTNGDLNGLTGSVSSVAGLCVESALRDAHGVLVATGRARGDPINMDVDVPGPAVVRAGDTGFVLRAGTRRLHQPHVLDDVARVVGHVGTGRVVVGDGKAGEAAAVGSLVLDAGRQPRVVAGAELGHCAARGVQRRFRVVLDATGGGVDGGGVA